MAACSVVQYDVQQRTVDLQPTLDAPGVLNEAQFSEPVHEKTYSRTSRSDHFCQRFLANFWDHSLRHSLLAKMSEHEKDARKSLFAGIEQLVDQILFVTDVAGKQVGHEHIGEGVFPMKRLHHRLLFDPEEM